MSHRLARTLGLIVLMLSTALFVQACADLPYPYELRFSMPAFNYWSIAFAAVGIPLAIALIGLAIRGSFSRRLMIGLAGILALPFGLFSGCAAMEAPELGAADSSFELLSQVEAGEEAYRLYRTDCGATCAYGLVLRKERDWCGIVKSTTPVWSLYRADQGTIVINGGKLKVMRGETVLTEIAL